MKMSNIKWTMVPGIAALAAILTLGLAGTATALHDGGVAHCDACHSMHNSPELPGLGTHSLLIGTDASSTCLNCHADNGGSYHVLSDNASNWSPGGDFFWLTESYTNAGGWYGAPSETSVPDNMGHNVVAVDFTLTVDATNTQAPGGTYPSSALGCNSCHNPHGTVNGGTRNGNDPISVSGSYGDTPTTGTIAGNYRLLRDSYDAGMTYDAPIAVTAGYGETDSVHPAYGQGMSEWCGNCHGDYLGSGGHIHPAANDEQLGSKATDYNNYVATGDFTGVQATAFTALVQFERQDTNIANLLTASTSTAGPDTTDNVMCLTCHRAHASAFDNITRWDMGHELLADSWPDAANLIAMGALPDSAYYGRNIATEFGDYQRSLCNKCHVKD
jgi:hypothetical protein